MTRTAYAGQYRQQPSGDAVEFFFYAVPTLMGVALIAMAVKVIGRHQQLRQAWASGLTAEARCLRTYTTTSRHGDGDRITTTLHHVYEFTPPGGGAVRFEEEDGPGTIVEGDFVTVYYAADRPEAATAQAPSPGKSAASLVAVLCFLGVGVAFCVFFMATAHDVFDAADLVFGTGDEFDTGDEFGPGDEFGSGDEFDSDLP